MILFAHGGMRVCALEEITNQNVKNAGRSA
jgi:hypothetical protein